MFAALQPVSYIPARPLPLALLMHTSIALFVECRPHIYDSSLNADRTFMIRCCVSVISRRQVFAHFPLRFCPARPCPNHQTLNHSVGRGENGRFFARLPSKRTFPYPEDRAVNRDCSTGPRHGLGDTPRSPLSLFSLLGSGFSL